MHRFLIILITFIFVNLPLEGFGAADHRVALVIGNGNYTDAPLRNPVNDARDMAKALKNLGFKVTLNTDANQRAMKESIRSFGRQLSKGGVGLFYFAGHGIQYGGRNYLIPVHAEVKSEADVEYEAVDAGRVLAQMEKAGNSLNIIILDACRNNPFARSFRSADKGLAKMDAPTGSILAYSTAPGSVAADGTGRNGIYTSSLLKHIQSSGAKLEDVFKKVRIDVMADTGSRQVPWESSSLTGDFYFNFDRKGSRQPVRAISVEKRQRPQNLNAEEETWEIVKTSSSVEDYKMFLDQFPGSRFSTAASLKIQQLKRKLNAQTMTAAVGPAFVDQGHTNNRKALQKRYRVALFPSHLYASGESKFLGTTELLSIKEIAAVASDDDRLTLKYSYKDLRGSTEGVTILNDISKNNVWKRKSAFSNMEPDWKAVRNIGLKIDVNLIIFIAGNVTRGTYKYYLYDPINNKVHTKEDRVNVQVFSKSSQLTVGSLFEDFFKQQ